MEVFRIEWVDINGGERVGAAWYHQLKDLVEELLGNKEVVVITILNSVGKVVFESNADGVVIDEFNFTNKSEE